MRTILHSDMNSFYASVEMLLDPSLRGKAVAVCGSTEDRHGIVLAKSEKAKKAGVKTGMVNWEARLKCPDLVIVPPEYDQYVRFSRLARQIYARFTDLVEPYGMDECWLDVTDSRRMGTGREIADGIRTMMREELGLTVSVGVSFNKIFAKLGSDLKKPDAVTEITPENFRETIWPLPADELLCVGRATARKLNMRGVFTIGDLANADPDLIRCWLGRNGEMIRRFAAGLDTSRVMPADFVSPVKSIGHGITCRADLYGNEEVWKVIYALSQDVGHRLRVHGLKACGVQVCVRANDLSGAQYQCRLGLPTRSPREIAAAGMRLFASRYPWKTYVRALTIRAILLIPETESEQPCLFTDVGSLVKRDRAESAVERVRERYGKDAILPASLIGDLKMPCDGREEVVMPGQMFM